MSQPDWIAIEGDYRAGIKSLRAMAAQDVMDMETGLQGARAAVEARRG